MNTIDSTINIETRRIEVERERNRLLGGGRATEERERPDIGEAGEVAGTCYGAGDGGVDEGSGGPALVEVGHAEVTGHVGPEPRNYLARLQSLPVHALEPPMPLYLSACQSLLWLLLQQLHHRSPLQSEHLQKGKDRRYREREKIGGVWIISAC